MMDSLCHLIRLLHHLLNHIPSYFRCTALYYAVSNLVLVIKGIVPIEMIDWVDSCLADIEGHLKVS